MMASGISLAIGGRRNWQTVLNGLRHQYIYQHTCFSLLLYPFFIFFLIFQFPNTSATILIISYLGYCSRHSHQYKCHCHRYQYHYVQTQLLGRAASPYIHHAICSSSSLIILITVTIMITKRNLDNYSNDNYNNDTTIMMTTTLLTTTIVMNITLVIIIIPVIIDFVRMVISITLQNSC